MPWWRVLALMLLAAAAAGPAQAQWKWRDANGQIHASDLPPPREVPDKAILQRPNSPASKALLAPAPTPTASAPLAVAPPKVAVDPELEARKKRADTEAAAKAKAEEDKLAQGRAENCKRARAHVATLESGQRIARPNDKGEREFLDDAGRADEVRRAREVIAGDCR